MYKKCIREMSLASMISLYYEKNDIIVQITDLMTKCINFKARNTQLHCMLKFSTIYKYV